MNENMNKTKTRLEFVCSDEKAAALLRAARMYDEWADKAGCTSYSQVSNALCSKENASPDELLQAVDQLKSRVSREGHYGFVSGSFASVHVTFGTCSECKERVAWYKHNNFCPSCGAKMIMFERSSDCEENTKEDAHESDHL